MSGGWRKELVNGFADRKGVKGVGDGRIGLRPRREPRIPWPTDEQQHRRADVQFMLHLPADAHAARLAGLSIENHQVERRRVERAEDGVVRRRLLPFDSAPVDRGAHRKAHFLADVAVIAVEQNPRRLGGYGSVLVGRHITHGAHSGTCTRGIAATLKRGRARLSNNGAHQGTRTQ